MAIIIDKGLEVSTVNDPVTFYAFANRIIKFHSDTLTPLYATVWGRKIYPSPSGHFEFNLKSVFVKKTKEFTKDLTDSDNITIGSHSSFFFGGAGLHPLIITITDDAGAVETYNFEYLFLMVKSVQYKEDMEIKPSEQTFKSYADYNLTVFKGYPFDFTFIGRDVELRNKNSDVIATTNKHPNRLYLYDGDNEMNTQDDDLIIWDTVTDDETGRIKMTYKDCEGTYIKWLSLDGTFKYWLFSDKKTVTNRAKDNGYWLNEFADDSTNANKYNSLGKSDLKEIIKLNAIGLKKYEREYLADIIDSPRVYLYHNRKGIQAKVTDFEQIKLMDNSFVVENAGRNQYRISISIERIKNPMY